MEDEPVAASRANGGREPDGEEIADLLSRIGRSFKARLRALPDSPARALSMPQRDVLVRIGRRPGTTPAGICERTGRDRGQVTRLVAELEALGLVGRNRSTQDRRSIVLCLTPAGAELFARMLERRAALSQSMLAGLTPDEISAFGATLRRVSRALQDDVPNGAPARPRDGRADGTRAT